MGFFGVKVERVGVASTHVSNRMCVQIIVKPGRSVARERGGVLSCLVRHLHFSPTVLFRLLPQVRSICLAVYLGEHTF